MEDASSNPVFVALLCVARCLVPLLIMLGISYLLRKFGLIKAAPKPPQDFLESDNDQD
ncbi:MAG TPA: hypothetical protein VLM83_06715 [Anaerolineales bacterium]|nr:hypothetical protein [Anaerolineales bacterium]